MEPSSYERLKKNHICTPLYPNVAKIKGIAGPRRTKGELAVLCCEPLATKGMRRLIFPACRGIALAKTERVNNTAILKVLLEFTNNDVLKCL